MAPRTPSSPSTRVAPSRDARVVGDTDDADGGLAVLLSRVGGAADRRLGEALAPLGLETRQVELLRAVDRDEGRSQQALAGHLGIVPSRMVALVDDLEKRGVLERRADPDDRRVRLLHLTARGRALLVRVVDTFAAHEAALSAGLSRTERRQLVALLRKVAAADALAHGEPRE